MRKSGLVVCAVIALSHAVEAQEPGPGYLFLGGGGIEDPALIARFVELAGGPEGRIVIIPTASADDNQARPPINTVTCRLEIEPTRSSTLLCYREAFRSPGE